MYMFDINIFYFISHKKRPPGGQRQYGMRSLLDTSRHTLSTRPHVPSCRYTERKIFNDDVKLHEINTTDGNNYFSTYRNTKRP